MLCKAQEDAVGILMWRARVYLGKAIHHANANFLPPQPGARDDGGCILDDR